MSEHEKLPRETLNAYIDGELTPAEMTSVAAVLANRPELRAYVERQLTLRNRLDAAFSSVMAQPVPEQLQDALWQTPPSWRATISSDLTRWRGILLGMRWWSVTIPASAALAVGLLVGVALDRSIPSQLPIVRDSSSGQILAQGPLVRALNEQLASEDDHDGSTHIGISFRNRVGDDCRSFAIAGNAASTAGIACHSGGKWVVAALAAGAPNPNPRAPYQMAGAAMPSIIRDTVNAMIVGEPFDAVTERKAREGNWPGLH